MGEEIICPICGKHGIPDYHKKDVVCPCCGSDLSIYRIVNQIPDDSKNWIWKISTAVAICVTAILTVFLAIILTVFLAINSNTQKLMHSETEFTQLVDSINTLNQQLSEVHINAPVESADGFLYVVRTGDSFWRISQRFYGTGVYAAKIAEMNKLAVQDILHPGDTLIIKSKEDYGAF